MHWVIADDANGHTFHALTADEDPPAEAHVPVWIFITGPNGWGANHGAITMQMLKKNENNGHFVS